MVIPDPKTVPGPAPLSCQGCLYQNKPCDVQPQQRRECSNCVQNGFRCIVQAKPARARAKKGSGYVEHLESRITDLEKILSKVPQGDGPLPRRHDHNLNAASPGLVLREAASFEDQDNLFIKVADNITHPLEQNSTELGGVELRLKQYQSNPTHTRFAGESSVPGLLSTACDHQNKARLDMWERPSTEAVKAGRNGFWQPPAWMSQGLSDHLQATGPSKYILPDDDLISTLVDLYLANVNLYFPLLHRPTFVEAISSGTYRCDDTFAALLLLVCAVGAQHSDDPRVFASPDAPQSAGWQWFKQVNLTRSSFLVSPSLYHIQAYCVTSLFLRYTSSASASWMLSGIALRMAQDIGAHRREVYCVIPTVQDELWKRTFWVLLCCDRVMSAALGRQCAIQDEDFDLDLPTDCDDEYWTNANPALVFQQPPGKPSLVSAFIHRCKLSFITAKCLRTLYSVKGSNSMIPPTRHQSEKEVVADLDSALDEWMKCLPAHLKWNPDGADDRFFHQSVMLHSAYNTARIAVHRNFISPREQSSHAMRSLAICTRAASSCSHILQTQLRRDGVPLWALTKQAFTSGIILMVGVWGSKRFGASAETSRLIDDARKCLDFMTACEARVYNAGRHADVFREITALSEVPVRDRVAKEPEDESSSKYFRVFYGDEDVFVIQQQQGPRKESSKMNRGSISPPSVPSSLSATPLSDLSATTAKQSGATGQEASWVDGISLVNDYGVPFSSKPEAYPEAQSLCSAQPQPHQALSMDPLTIWSTIPWGAEPEVWGTFIDTLVREDATQPSVAVSASETGRG